MLWYLFLIGTDSTTVCEDLWFALKSVQVTSLFSNLLMLKGNDDGDNSITDTLMLQESSKKINDHVEFSHSLMQSLNHSLFPRYMHAIIQFGSLNYCKLCMHPTQGGQCGLYTSRVHWCCGTNLLRLHHKAPWSQLCLKWKCFIKVNINCCRNEWIYTHKSKTLTGRHLLSHCRQIILPEWKISKRIWRGKKKKKKLTP